MKVKELIEKLSSYDPDSLFVTRGFDEEGFADIGALEVVYLQKRKSESAIQSLGEYEQSEFKGQKAILIDHS